MMRFDTVIIGGGLAGLVCGIRLAQQGERCAIVSLGHSALHFSSGSLELLGALPDGEKVYSPAEAFSKLVEEAPSHPYAKFSRERFLSLAEQGAVLLREAGVDVYGGVELNHYRLSPTGTMKPAWLTFEGFVHSPNEDALPWRSVALFNAEGFLDLYTQFLGDSMRRMGTQCHAYTFNLPELERIRENPTEMRSANIARIFDKAETLDALAGAIASQLGDEEAVLLPAVLGVDCRDGVKRLERRLNRPVAVVATLPPSVPGIQAQTLLRRYFQELGGVYMLGDSAVGYKAEGDNITHLYTVNHGDIPFMAKNFVLATGSFFSGGLMADKDGVHEPLFGADVWQLPTRGEWYDRDLFRDQAYERFGVMTDDEFRAMRGGRSIENLYVVGAALSGFNAVKEGCGAGVSILTAIDVAERIKCKK